MNTHIVAEPTGLMKKIALDSLRGRWKDVFMGVTIYLLLTTYISVVLSILFPSYETVDYFGQQLQMNLSLVGNLYTVVLTGAFKYGFVLFLLTFFRTRKTDNKLIFEGFSMIGKTIALQIVMSIFIALWSILLIVPGIIAAIRYSQAFYILADHPEYSVMQCIQESKARMRGNCGPYFVLMLSFIGWYLLAYLCAGLIATPFGNGMGSLIGELISIIPTAYLMTYVSVTQTVFYELLTQNLVVMVPDQQLQEQGVNPNNMVNANYEVHEKTEATTGVADNLADIQEKAEQKIGDIIPDSFEQKIDDFISRDDTPASGAPDVDKQVYDASKDADAINDKPSRSKTDEIDDFGGPKEEKDEL